MEEYFDWVHKLYQVEEDVVIRMNGLDSLIYLLFMKYIGFYFAVTATLSMVVLLPTYLWQSDDDLAYLNKYTLLNGINNQTKQWIFFYVTFLCGICDHVFLLLYKRRISGAMLEKKKFDKEELTVT